MAVTPFKTFSAGEILTAADLNSSFSQITSNGEDLGWPATKAKDLNGNELILDGDADTSITADTDDQVDFKLGGVDVLRLNTVLSAVNGIDFTAAATGNAPFFSAFGSDTNVNLDLKPKGTGGARFLDKNGNEVLVGADGIASAVNELTVQNAATANAPQLQATGGDTNIDLDLKPKGTGGVRLLDKNGNEILIGADGTASAVNQVTITNAATGNDPIISPSGGDTNIGLTLTPKGTGGVTVASTDAAGGTGPLLNLDRNSASPAAADFLGKITFIGRDSGAGVEDYAKIIGQIVDPTAASEDGELEFHTVVAGASANRLSLAAGLFTSGATGGDQGTDTINASGLFDDGVQILPQDLKTEIATTSGTAHDFTGIHAAARRITIMFEGVSLSATDEILVQIGDSGGFETTGYVSGSSSAVTSVTSTSGYVIRTALAANAVHGHMVLTLSDSANNTWIESHSGHVVSTGANSAGGGSKSLSAVLTQVRVTRSGTDTFDAGAVNILVE